MDLLHKHRFFRNLRKFTNLINKIYFYLSPKQKVYLIRLHRNLAARVVPEVDIIVGAHSHTLLFNGETPNGDTALGEYPTVVTQDNGHRVRLTTLGFDCSC